MVDAAGAVALDYEQARYSKVAILLHWAIALLIILNWPLGYFRGAFPRDWQIITLHKSIGFTVLALTLVRIGWRLAHRPPAFDPVLKRWETGLAHAVHMLFYLLLLALPISGWVMGSAGTRGGTTSYFWLFPIGPLPIAQSEELHDSMEALHGLMGWAMLALVILHVAGALKHHLEGHRHLLRRMAPFLYRRRA